MGGTLGKRFDVPLIVIWCYLVLVLYIIAGNCLTFNLGDRFPVKLAELASLPLLLYFFVRKIELFGYRKYILGWLAIGTMGALFGMVLFNFTIQQVAYGLMYGIRILHLLLITCVISKVLSDNGIDLIRVILHCYSMVCFIGFFQLIVFPIAFDWYSVFNQIGAYWPNPDPHQGRMLSTYLDPNFLASCLCIPASISLFKWRNDSNSRYVLYFALFAIAIVMTNSRSGFLGLAVVVFYFSITSLRGKTFLKSIFMVGCALCALCALCAFEAEVLSRIMSISSDASAGARFVSWDFSLKAFSSNPLLGVGFNLIGAFRENVFQGIVTDSAGYGVDSSLLLILVCTGLTGFVYAIYVLLKDVFGMTNAFGDKTILRALMAVGLSALIICNFNNLLFYPLWLFVALLLRDKYALSVR